MRIFCIRNNFDEGIKNIMKISELCQENVRKLGSDFKEILNKFQGTLD